MGGLEIVILIMIAGHVFKDVFNDAAASARGKTPPSQTRWEKRENRRAAAGRPSSNSDPSYGKRLWDNATERWAEKSTHRHQARLGYIAERGPVKGERWKERKLRRADRWDQAREKVAGAGGGAWRLVTTTPGKNKPADDNTGGQTTAPDEAAPRKDDAEVPEAATAGVPDRGGQLVDRDGAEQDGAERGRTVPVDLDALSDAETSTGKHAKPDGVPPGPAQPGQAGQANPEVSAPTGGAANQTGEPLTMTTTQQTGEVTNLVGAIGFCREMATYLEAVSTRLEEPQSQSQAAAADLGQSQGAIENVQAGLAAVGFGPAVTGPIGSTQESTTTAGTAIGQVAGELASAREKLGAAAAAFTQAANVLAQQQGLAEQAQAHAASGAGVAKDTDFYVNA